MENLEILKLSFNKLIELNITKSFYFFTIASGDHVGGLVDGTVSSRSVGCGFDSSS